MTSLASILTVGPLCVDGPRQGRDLGDTAAEILHEIDAVAPAGVMHQPDRIEERPELPFCNNSLCRVGLLKEAVVEDHRRLAPGGVRGGKHFAPLLEIVLRHLRLPQSSHQRLLKKQFGNAQSNQLPPDLIAGGLTCQHQRRRRFPVRNRFKRRADITAEFVRHCLRGRLRAVPVGKRDIGLRSKKRYVIVPRHFPGSDDGDSQGHKKVSYRTINADFPTGTRSAEWCAMTDALTILGQGQRQVFADADLTDPYHHYNRLLFAEVEGLFHVEYFGDCYDEPFTHVLNAIAHPEVAERLAVLHFDGPDEGANGTREWDFSRLLETNAVFPRMISFRVAWERPGDHNHPIVGHGYEEAGMIARLLDRMPNLGELTVPSAPNATFFDRPPHPLAYLKVATGYEHQDFVLNLSRSRCFPKLFRLDFGDYSQTYDAYPGSCVPFDQYVALFQSLAMASVLCGLWYAPLTPAQYRQLQALKPHFSWMPPLPV